MLAVVVVVVSGGGAVVVVSAMVVAVVEVDAVVRVNGGGVPTMNAARMPASACPGIGQYDVYRPVFSVNVSVVVAPALSRPLVSCFDVDPAIANAWGIFPLFAITNL